MYGFAGRHVVIKEPYHLPVEVCGVKFMHPFYALPCIYQLHDLIGAAELVIDRVRQLVCSH